MIAVGCDSGRGDRAAEVTVVVCGDGSRADEASVAVEACTEDGVQGMRAVAASEGQG